MKRVIHSVDGGMLRKSTMNNMKGIDRHKLSVGNTFQKIRFEEAVAMLHYCRLLHKSIIEVPSMALSQWLITLSEAMVSAKI